jgi:hypothetical protein
MKSLETVVPVTLLFNPYPPANQPEFLTFIEFRNLLQRINSPAYVAWRAGTKSLFLLGS